MSAEDLDIDGAPSDDAIAPPAMPTVDAFETLAEYERRSLAHVAGLPEQLQAAGLWRGIGYRIGRHRLVSGYEAVAEIITVPQITPVPGAQPWMLGVANVRDFGDRMAALPRWITPSRAGEGFVELADALLAARP